MQKTLHSDRVRVELSKRIFSKAFSLFHLGLTNCFVLMQSEIATNSIIGMWNASVACVVYIFRHHVAGFLDLLPANRKRKTIFATSTACQTVRQHQIQPGGCDIGLERPEGVV